MRKIIFCLFCLLVFTDIFIVNAASVPGHPDFQEVTFPGVTTSKLLYDMDESIINSAYRRVKRKAFGWSVENIVGDQLVYYKGDTVFAKNNNTSQSLKFTYYYEEEKSTTTSISASSTLSGEIGGKIKGINASLDETIRAVTDISAFIEKILIFEAGLDDKIIEFAKSIYRSVYKEVNPSVKDFKIRFSPPDLDAVNELEHDYHFKIINYEDDVYNVIPLDKSKIEKNAEYIEIKEKELKLNSYFIGESWGDAILTGECKSKNGFYSIIDDDRTVQNTKYHQDFDKMKSETKNINKLDSDGYTLLKHAVLADDFNEVKSLLEKGADPNVQMAGKRVVLHYALQNGISTQIIDLLMEYGADINSVASNKLKPLDLIDLRKPVAYLKHMFDLGASCDGDSLLRSYAAHATDVDCIKLLIEKGFSLEARDRNCDFDASCEAICNNNSNQFLEQFLEIGCDPNAKYNGTPCLFSIFDEYYPDLCEEGFYLTRLKLLLQYGADINITDNSKRSAIMIACKKCRRIEIVQFFLLYKPDLTLRDSKGNDVFEAVSFASKSMYFPL